MYIILLCRTDMAYFKINSRFSRFLIGQPLDSADFVLFGLRTLGQSRHDSREKLGQRSLAANKDASWAASCKKTWSSHHPHPSPSTVCLWTKLITDNRVYFLAVSKWCTQFGLWNLNHSLNLEITEYANFSSHADSIAAVLWPFPLPTPHSPPV